jgi:hypothetical protein
MSKPEKFLERWSRRKREAVKTNAPEATKEPSSDGQLENEQQVTPVLQDDVTVANEGGFDLAALPPVDSIGANTDIRDFLRPEVPSDLTREALRRAWSSDPAIRDYIGPVENGWDFNDPNAVPGFGTINAEDITRLLTEVFGVPTGEKGEPSTTGEPEAQQDASSARASSIATAASDVTSQGDWANIESPQRDTNVVR